jgi:tRNA pseudouridine38-40 synthase
MRMLVAYDGSSFSGFQYQPGRRTVQGVLEDALSSVSKGRLPGASRVSQGRRPGGTRTPGARAR